MSVGINRREVEVELVVLVLVGVYGAEFDVSFVVRFF